MCYYKKHIYVTLQHSLETPKLMHVCAGGKSTYAMFPELFDYSQAEDIGYLCLHRKTGGQDVSILNMVEEIRQESGFTFTKDTLLCHFQILMSYKQIHRFFPFQLYF